ncbi:MAG: hypothetical protein LBS97_00220 [Treponema sp.]|jgi:ComF family protein|nr:hypothetical protein [Treponema sp.]
MDKNKFLAVRRFFLRAAHALRFFLYAALTVLLGAEFCVCCGKKCRVLPLCASCRKKMTQYVSFVSRCGVCGKPLISEIGVCMGCRKEQTDKPETGGAGEAAKTASLDFCFPVFSYQMWRQELVFLWKTRGVRLFSRFFADILAQALTNELRIAEALPEGAGNYPVIVPVPPRPGKILEKGWDQVEDLCKWLEGYYCLPVMRLLKRRSAVQQKKLDSAQRLENARNAYYLSKRGAQKVPKRVILLDDVRTTGATLEICAKILKHAGCREVRAVALFGLE